MTHRRRIAIVVKNTKSAGSNRLRNRMKISKSNKKLLANIGFLFFIAFIIINIGKNQLYMSQHPEVEYVYDPPYSCSDIPQPFFIKYLNYGIMGLATVAYIVFYIYHKFVKKDWS